MSFGEDSPWISAGEKAEILESLTKGISPITACRMAGVSHKMYKSKREDADAGDAEEQDFLFFKAVALVEGAIEIQFIKDVFKAAIYDWKAAVWMLEHRFPDLYGKSTTKSVDCKITTDYSELDKETIVNEAMKILANVG